MVGNRELHGDGDDGTTVVISPSWVNFIIDTAVIEGMGIAFTGAVTELCGKAAVAVTDSVLRTSECENAIKIVIFS